MRWRLGNSTRNSRRKKTVRELARIIESRVNAGATAAAEGARLRAELLRVRQLRTRARVELVHRTTALAALVGEASVLEPGRLVTPARLELPSGSTEFVGRVTAIGATVDATTRRVVVRIDIPYGVAVRDIQNLVESAVGGHTVTQVIEGARRFDVAVRFPSELNRDPAAIGELLLLAPGGERVRLGQVATLRLVSAPEAISHEQGQRRLVVQANVRGRDLGGFVADAQQHVAGAVSLPAGYFIDWGGQFENQRRATSRLVLVVPLSLAIIFFLLYVTFTSVRQALLVIVNVPFALVGGIAALWIRGLNLNLSASVGFIALFGVAVLNGIVLIAAVNALRGKGEDLRDAVLEGAATRLKPVLMTALVAALGFVPMAVSTGAGAEVQRPLASVVVGGIITSTLLTLIVLPTLYEMMEARALRRTRALK